MTNEKELDIFSKVKNRVIWPRNCTLSFIPKRNKNISESKSMYTNAPSSIIYDSQNNPNAQRLMSGYTIIVVYPHAVCVCLIASAGSDSLWHCGL